VALDSSKVQKEGEREGWREGRREGGWTYRVMRMMPVAHMCSFGFSTAAISRRLKVEG
jgi:hypothetical protein